MRISDWSSDVCSSDLKFLETLAQTCNVSEAARVVGRNLSTVYYLKRRDPAFARAWKQALSIGHEELRALMLRQALFGTEDEEIVLDGDGAVKSRKRSEEHTSELQSLMRISYAVFCLKKKKSKITANKRESR